VASPDGASIAVFRSGMPTAPPLILVHGAAADHTTFRIVGPMLGESFDVYAIDRRGRGASGDPVAAPSADGPAYAIEWEYDDVAAVAEAVAATRESLAVDVFGHSYGGRCALGAALQSSVVGRVIAYEGAPSVPDERYGDAALIEELRALASDGRNEDLLVTFLTRVVGMDAVDLARYRSDAVWPKRVAAAPTIVREMAGEASDAAAIETLGAVRQPVLQLLGGDSVSTFASATAALDARLADGRVVVIPGARHAAHHTHPDAVVAAVRAFLRPSM
jgi:pimeloyl-ACP methyl ester carboxylesterase